MRKSDGELVWVGCWLYADDLVLVADNEEDMQAMVDAVVEYANQWRFSLSGAKSKIVKFGSGKGKGRAIQMNGRELEVNESFNYLGVELERWNRWKVMGEKVVAKTAGGNGWVAGQLAKKRWKVSVSMRKRVWESYVRPRMEYGVEVWEPSKKEAKKMEQLLTKGGRMILGVGKCTAGIVVRGELGWITMEARRDTLLLRFVGKLERMKDSRLIGRLYRAGKEAWIAGNRACSKWWARLQRVTEKYGLVEEWRCGQIREMESGEWAAMVKE